MYTVPGSLSDRFPAGFRQRCTENLEHLGDVAADAQRHDDAITQYSAALSLDLSKVYMAKGLWEVALNEVNRVRPRGLGWVGSYRHMIIRR